MALFDIIIPELVNCAQNCNLSENLMNQDWNHWKLQIQSLIEDAKQSSQTNHADPDRPENPQSNDSQQSPVINFDELQQFVGQFVRLSPQKKSSQPNQVNSNGNKYEIKLDVSHFEPHEITVKTVSNNVIVIGKHDERKDRLGLVSRQLTRRYELPDDVEPETIVSALTPKGILMIEGLKKVSEPKPEAERVIAVIRSESKPSTSKQKYQNEQTLD